MLTLVDSNNSKQKIKPEKYGLYKLRVRSEVEVAISEKPVFGANVTFLPKAFEYANYNAQSNSVLGWVDHGGLSHFIVESSQPNNKKDTTSATLPSQFLNADNGILRITMAMRIYLIAKTPKEIQQNGLCYFTPV